MDTTSDDMRTAELRREIAQRRDDIGRDLEVIGDRVSPARMVDRSRERTRRRFSSLRERVMGSPGSDWNSSGYQRSGYQNTTGEPGRPMSERAGDRLSALTTEMAGRDPAAAVGERVQGSPLAMGFVAFGIGFVLGSVIPATRTEEDLARRVEPRLTDLAEDVGDTARHAADNLAPALEEETSAMKDEAKQAVETVADKGKQEMSAAREQIG